MPCVLLIVPRVNSSFCQECANYGTLFYSIVSYAYTGIAIDSVVLCPQVSVVSTFPLHYPILPCSCGLDLVTFLQYSLFAGLSSFLKVLVAIEWSVVQCPESINKCLYIVRLDLVTHVEWCTKLCIGQTKLTPSPQPPIEVYSYVRLPRGTM